MHKHPYFDLLIHDDAELSKILGRTVISRTTLHTWPLSSVEAIEFDDDSKLIYKSQRGLLTELEFYRQVKSPHIPQLHYSASQGDYSWLLLEYIEGTPPVGGSIRVEELIKIIHKLPYTGPYWHDLSPQGFDTFSESTDILLNTHGYVETAQVLRKSLAHPEVKKTIEAGSGLLHGDFNAKNILVRPNGHIIILDWQRALYGPPAIDLCDFLIEQGVNPVPIAGLGAEILRLVLAIRWFIDCKDKWFGETSFIDEKMSIIADKLVILTTEGDYGNEMPYRFE